MVFLVNNAPWFLNFIQALVEHIFIPAQFIKQLSLDLLPLFQHILFALSGDLLPCGPVDNALFYVVGDQVARKALDPLLFGGGLSNKTVVVCLGLLVGLFSHFLECILLLGKREFVQDFFLNIRKHTFGGLPSPHLFRESLQL